MCPVTSGTGDEAMVACNLAQNLTMADDDGLLGNFKNSIREPYELNKVDILRY